MSRSHTPAPKPSPLLALIALAIVHRFRPEWCALGLAEAAASEGVRAERLSRLCTRACAAFEPIVLRLSARGRPPSARGKDDVRAELGVTQSLLEVATAVLDGVSPWRRPIARHIVVSAWLRLQAATPGLTQTAFASALALSPRTLRSWLADETLRQPPSPPPRGRPDERPPRRLRRPRFRFDLHVPDLQFATDTTDLEMFASPLKLIGVQDVGGRDRDLLDSVIIDDHESSKLVVRALKDALTGLPGAQVLTDQGTPYMAKRTRAALAALAVEHAPQKEGDAPGKATIERAFGLLKPILAPLADLTNELALAVPQLRDGAIAKAGARLLVTALLRAYQAGARATRRAMAANATLTEEELARVAQQARETARATDRSARLFLGHVYDLYILPTCGSEPKQRKPCADGQAPEDGPVTKQRARKCFVDGLRRYPVEVLQHAERAFRQQVHRSDIRDRASYFARLVRDAHASFKKLRSRQREQQEQHERDELAIARVRRDDAANLENPAGWLRKAFELIATQWQPATRTLLANGAGLGAVYLRGAIVRLLELHGPTTATDIAKSVFRDFACARHDALGPLGIAAIQALLDRSLPALATSTASQSFGPQLVLDTLTRAGKNRHRPRVESLSN
jgi:hypothetical protein